MYINFKLGRDVSHGERSEIKGQCHDGHTLLYENNNVHVKESKPLKLSTHVLNKKNMSDVRVQGYWQKFGNDVQTDAPPPPPLLIKKSRVAMA